MNEKKRFKLNQEILKHWSSEAFCAPGPASLSLRKRSPEKMLSFGQLVQLFYDVEIQDLKESLGLNIAKGTTDPRVEFSVPKSLV